MNAKVQSDALRRTARVLSWLVGGAVAATLLFVLGLMRSNAGHPLLAPLAPMLAVLVLSCETAAFVVFLIGLIRWPLQVVRSPRWLLSALGGLLVAAAVVFFLLMMITAAISLP